MSQPMSLILFSAAIFASAAACTDAQGNSSDKAGTPPAAQSAVAAPKPELTAEERKFYRDVAKSAWTYLEANYKPATGFVSATADWPNTTIWDIGGQLLAFRAAKELGLLTPAEFTKRSTKALSTLEKAPLDRGVAYNKV